MRLFSNKTVIASPSPSVILSAAKNLSLSPAHSELVEEFPLGINSAWQSLISDCFVAMLLAMTKRAPWN